MIVDKLIKIGFNESEAKAYIILMEKGWVLASQLARELDLSQTAAKNILNFFIEEGIGKYTKIQKKMYYSLTEPEKLKEYCERRESELIQKIQNRKKSVNELIADIKIEYGDTSAMTAFYVEGFDNIKDIHSMVLNCKKREVYEIVPLDQVRLIPSSSDHRIKMKKSDIKFNVIYASKAGDILPSEEKIKRYNFPFEDSKKTGKGQILSEILFFDDKVVFFSYDQSKNMVITDARLAETLKCLFFAAIESGKVTKCDLED